MSAVLILIPAAGGSSRMRGRDKLLEEVNGLPLLARQVRRALETGQNVFVTIPREHPKRLTALSMVAHPNLISGPPIDGREGIAVSVRLAVQVAESLSGPAAPEGLMILLADLPDLDTADLEELIERFRGDPDRVHRAAAEDGTPGHPVIFPKRLFPALAAVKGDEGARMVLKGEEVILHPLPDRRATTDLDTPEDWENWRARTPK